MRPEEKEWLSSKYRDRVGTRVLVGTTTGSGYYCCVTNYPIARWLKTILFCSLFCDSGIKEELSWVVALAASSVFVIRCQLGQDQSLEIWPELDNLRWPTNGRQWCWLLARISPGSVHWSTYEWPLRCEGLRLVRFLKRCMAPLRVNMSRKPGGSYMASNELALEVPSITATILYWSEHSQSHSDSKGDDINPRSQWQEGQGICDRFKNLPYLVWVWCALSYSVTPTEKLWKVIISHISMNGQIYISHGRTTVDLKIRKVSYIIYLKFSSISFNKKINKM